MAVYKDNATGTWRVIYRFTNWKGERKQTQKRGFATKREAQAWEHEVMLKQNSKLDIVTKLKSFSDKYGICLPVVHHTRKLESEDSFDMISGTNGLLGAADGAFIMHKKKRTDNEAVMDIVGRDQPDQELTIEFDRERCVWKFKKAETELWKQPPNPLLEAINVFLTEDRQAWEGTATELVKQLPDIQIQANVLSRRLNTVNSQLLNDYGIFYDNKRGHERKIILKRLEVKE